MRISFDKFDLTPAVDLVQQGVNEKSPMEIYRYLLMEANEEGEILLRSNNGMLGLESKVVGEVLEAGAYSVPAKKLFAIAQTFASDQKIVIESEPGNRICMTSGKGKYRLACRAAEEFPAFLRNKDRAEEEVFTMNGEQFRLALDQTLFAAAEKPDRNLDSVFFNFIGDRFETVTGDATIMSRVVCIPEDDNDIGNRQIMLPLESAKHARRVFNGAYEISMWQRASEIVLSDGSSTLYSRLQAGDYVNYSRAFEPIQKHEAFVDRTELITLLKRVGILATLQKSNMLQISIATPKSDDAKAMLTASVSIKGEGDAEDTIEIESASEPVVMNFNCELLIGILSGMKTKVVKLHYSDALTWIRLESTDQRLKDDQTCLIPPMKAKKGE